MQPQFFAGACGQLDQVESAVPFAVKSQRVFLPVVAIIPDEIDRLCLPIKQAIERLDAIAVNEIHRCLTNAAGFSSRTQSKQRLFWQADLQVRNCGAIRSRLRSLPALKGEVSWSKF